VKHIAALAGVAKGIARTDAMAARAIRLAVVCLPRVSFMTVVGKKIIYTHW